MTKKEDKFALVPRVLFISSLFLIGFLFSWPLTAQEESYADTLKVAGKNIEDLSKYATYWVDSDGNGQIASALSALEKDRFDHWPLYTTLNLGLNPDPLWLHLTVQNIDEDPQTYWWSIYSHADSVVVFKKLKEEWHAIDTILFHAAQQERSIPVRFMATAIDLRSGETAELLMRIQNLRTPQHAYTDFTTPDHNLLWEKHFYWTIGFFIGALMLVVLFNLSIGIHSSQRVFFLFASYILIVAFIILKEELLLVAYPSQAYFPILIRFSAMGLTMIGCGIHYFIIMYVIEAPPHRSETNGIARVLNYINLGGLAYGLLFSFIYFGFRNQLSFDQIGFRISWYVGVVVIFIMMMALSAKVLTSIQYRKQILPAIAIALFLFYFNVAGYYLNYEGMINYYTITYPNSFFWGLCVEFIAFALLIAVRYRQTLKSNYNLQQEQLQHKTELFEKEIETQERERTQIARDIHDDLGATISALKLIITNSYRQDEHLVYMVNKASSDLRFFLTNFSVSNIRSGLFSGVKRLIEDINALEKIRFILITSGYDDKIHQDIAVAAFRIIAELITNILKHSEATEATIQIMVDEEQLLIMAEDNGKGFDVTKEYHGMGLENIRARSKRFNGNVHTVSDTRSGTTSIITIPNHNR